MILRLFLDTVAKEDGALEGARDLGPGEAEPGLGHIDEADETIDDGSGFICRVEVFEFLGDANHQRAVNSAGVYEALAPGEHAAVVGAVNHDGVVSEAILFEFGKALADFLVHLFYGIGILSVGFADLQQVGVIGEQLHLGGIVAGVFVVPVRLALVAVSVVDDGEKGLAGSALFPPIGDFLTLADIPGIVVVTPPDVVVGLTGIGGVIAGFAQQVRVVGDPGMRKVIAASHRL